MPKADAPLTRSIELCPRGLGDAASRHLETSRMHAALKGDMRFMGNDCNYGHGGLRYTSNGVCCQCQLSRSKDYRWKIKELLRAARKAPD